MLSIGFLKRRGDIPYLEAIGWFVVSHISQSSQRKCRWPLDRWARCGGGRSFPGLSARRSVTETWPFQRPGLGADASLSRDSSAITPSFPCRRSRHDSRWPLQISSRLYWWRTSVLFCAATGNIGSSWLSKPAWPCWTGCFLLLPTGTQTDSRLLGCRKCKNLH